MCFALLKQKLRFLERAEGLPRGASGGLTGGGDEQHRGDVPAPHMGSCGASARRSTLVPR